MTHRFRDLIKAAFVGVFLLAAAFLASEQNTSTTQAQTAAPSPTPAAAATPFDQAKAIAELTAQIKGKEQEPAETVFKNIQMFKGMPAARILRIMEMGYARSLGVDCTHCHVAGQWEKEDKTTKQTARDMAAMMGKINSELLKNIKNLRSPNPIVNCTTCHRGQVKPATDLGTAKS